MRLTNDIRTSIINKVLVHRFTELLDALAKDHAAVAHLAWVKHMGPIWMKDLKLVPEGWLRTRDIIGVHMPQGTYFQLHFSGHPATIPSQELPTGWKAPKTQHGSWKYWPEKLPLAMKIYDGDELLTRLRKLMDATSDIRSTMKTAREALGVVSEFHSDDALTAAWPELEPFVRSSMPAPKPKPPALQTDRLNQLLDLPVD